MSSTFERVLRDALDLPGAERARLAAEVLASLGAPDEAPERTDREWVTELERRAREAEERPGRPWSEVRQAIENRLRR